MKRIISLILTLFLVLSTVPLNAQEITISREEFMSSANEIDGILAKEFNNYVIKNPEAAYKEFRAILREKSKQYNPDQAKTYRDKQTYRNRAFMPSISPKEKYPNSTYFKKEGDFYRYAIAARNASLETKTPLGYEDFRNHAENEIRRMFLQESKDENVLKEINLDNKRSPINDASYLAGYYAQNLAFTEAVREANLTLNSSDCKSAQSKKDKDCINAGILGQYNYKLFESANQNVIKHISTIAPMMNRCLNDVLAPLQAKKIALQEIEEYLDEHSNLPWASCAVNYDEAKQLILDNTISRAEAEDMIDNTGFGQKLLKTLDYISFSYYVNRASAIEDFKMGIEDEVEDMSNAEIYREAQISDILSNSLNKVLAQIASNYIAYGQVFYYDVESFSGKSDKFAEGWHNIATNEIYQGMPIAKLANDAITRSGRRGYQDKTLAKSMQQVRFESNAKSQVEILTIAADFVMDPTMLLAPIGETVTGLKLANKVAQVAPKTTAKVAKATEAVGKGIQTAKTAVKDSRVGKAVTKATEPVRQLKSKTGQIVGDAFDDWSNMGRHLDDTPKTAKGLNKGTDATTDVVEDFTKATPAPKPEPKTALNPDELTPKLTGELDDLVASAKSPGTPGQSPNSSIGSNDGIKIINNGSSAGTTVEDGAVAFKHLDDAKSVVASEHRLQLLDKQISDLNSQIENSQKGIKGFFNRKQTKELQKQRDLLQRQLDIDKTLSDPTITVKPTTDGNFLASSKRGNIENNFSLNENELNDYINSLRPEEKNAFYKRNPKLKYKKENVENPVELSRYIKYDERSLMPTTKKKVTSEKVIEWEDKGFIVGIEQDIEEPGLTVITYLDGDKVTKKPVLSSHINTNAYRKRMDLDLDHMVYAEKSPRYKDQVVVYYETKNGQIVRKEVPANDYHYAMSTFDEDEKAILNYKSQSRTDKINALRRSYEQDNVVYLNNKLKAIDAEIEQLYGNNSEPFTQKFSRMNQLKQQRDSLRTQIRESIDNLFDNVDDKNSFVTGIIYDYDNNQIYNSSKRWLWYGDFRPGSAKKHTMSIY